MHAECEGGVAEQLHRRRIDAAVCRPARQPLDECGLVRGGGGVREDREHPRVAGVDGDTLGGGNDLVVCLLAAVRPEAVRRCGPEQVQGQIDVAVTSHPVGGLNQCKDSR